MKEGENINLDNMPITVFYILCHLLNPHRRRKVINKYKKKL